MVLDGGSQRQLGLCSCYQLCDTWLVFWATLLPAAQHTTAICVTLQVALPRCLAITMPSARTTELLPVPKTHAQALPGTLLATCALRPPTSIHRCPPGQAIIANPEKV